MTWKIFLVVWETFIVNSTSWAHVLPSSFIQQIPSCAATRAWILLIDWTIFCQSVQNVTPLIIFSGVIAPPWIPTTAGSEHTTLTTAREDTRQALPFNYSGKVFQQDAPSSNDDKKQAQEAPKLKHEFPLVLGTILLAAVLYLKFNWGYLAIYT